MPPTLPSSNVDIVVPVSGAAEALARCAQRLVAHTDLARHRVRLVLDGPPDGAEDPGRLEDWPHTSPQAASFADHAAEMEALYEEVLSSASRERRSA